MPLTVEGQVRSYTSPCGISDGEGGKERDLAPTIWFLPVSIIPPTFSNQSLIDFRRYIFLANGTVLNNTLKIRV